MDLKQKAILKNLLLNNNLAFTKYFFKQRTNQTLISNIHHKIIGETLDKVFNGEITRLIVNMPPRYTKTEQIVISFIAQGFAINPSSEFIHSSYADSLVMKNSMIIKDLIQHEKYQELFPMNLKKDSQSKKAWQIDEHGGKMLATSSGGTITGFGAGRMGFDDKFTGALVIDDPLKPKDANSEAIRQKINEQMNDTFKSRLAAKNIPIIVVMQRLHDDDMSGFLLNGGTGEKWHHLCLPAIIDEKTKNYDYKKNPYGIPIDISEVSNGPLWESKHNLKDINNMLESNLYVTSAQYLQSPTARGGSIFKSEWFQYYDKDIKDAYDFRFITGDTAQKTANYNDYSVFGCFGVTNKKLYLIDVVRGKWESPQLKQTLINFFNKHNNVDDRYGNLRAVHIEDKSSGTDIIQNLKNIMPIRPIQRNTDKITRAFDVVPYLQTGLVYFPQNADWLTDLENELQQFTPTFSHKHDDQVDMFMDGIQIGLIEQNKVVSYGW
jgi:predicted phage terminase large subunit-like protein